MNATVTKIFDVFISHASADRQLAAKVAESFESDGLETFYSASIPPGADIEDSIWQALAESRALLVIVSPDLPTHAMGMIELGGAIAWSKPVYLIINGPPSYKLPPVLSSYPAYPLSRLEDVIRAIREGIQPLTNDESELLIRLYKHLGIPSDQLSQTPHALRELAKEFNEQIGRQYSGERLLSELIRMRKRGELPRMKSRD